MARVIAVLIALTLLVCTPASWAGPGPGNQLPDARFAPGEVIVKYKAGVGTSARALMNRTYGAATLAGYDALGVYHLRLPAGESVAEAVARLSAHPDVEYAEPNYISHIYATPNDTSVGDLWGMENTGQTVNSMPGTADADMDAPEAWDVRTDSRSAGIIVAVVDSGVDWRHEDLAANIWTNPGEVAGDGVDNDGNGYIDDVHGWDFVEGDSDPMDENSHGSHVSGTIAAVGNNGVGVAGVNWTADIMALRAGDAFGYLLDSDIIGAIQYATDNGADVINASFGSTSPSQAIRDAIAAFGAAGGLFVAAAGNDGTNNDTDPHYPSSYTLDNIISVAATDQDDALAAFSPTAGSNYGATTVDVGAPGVNTLSSIPEDVARWTDDFDDGDIVDWTGTGTWAVTNAVSNSPSWSLTDSPGANYQPGTDTWARSPVADLTGQDGCKLIFEGQMALDLVYDISGNAHGFALPTWLYTLGELQSMGYDVLVVEGSPDGTTWTAAAYVIGNDQGAFRTDGGSPWPYEIGMGFLDGEATAYVRFRLVTDGANNWDGVYIDDAKITCVSASSTSYTFYQGTSMATPHVAGVAALVMAEHPGISNLEAKRRILESADPVAGLAGVTVTGGRVNVANALFPPPTNLQAQAVSRTQIDLAWTDNSLAVQEAGFVVERKGWSDTTWQVAGTINVPDTTSWSDTGLAPFSAFDYRVRALTGTGQSAPSNTAQAATLSDRQDVSGTSACFIATAAYGSPLAEEVQSLRDFRDRYLLGNAAGRLFVATYYALSPPLAEFIGRHETLRGVVRAALLPVVAGARYPMTALVLVGMVTAGAVGLRVRRERRGR